MQFPFFLHSGTLIITLVDRQLRLFFSFLLLQRLCHQCRNTSVDVVGRIYRFHAYAWKWDLGKQKTGASFEYNNQQKNLKLFFTLVYTCKSALLLFSLTPLISSGCMIRRWICWERRQPVYNWYQMERPAKNGRGGVQKKSLSQSCTPANGCAVFSIYTI